MLRDKANFNSINPNDRSEYNTSNSSSFGGYKILGNQYSDKKNGMNKS